MAHSIAAQDSKPCGCDEQVNFKANLVGSIFILPKGTDFNTFINKLPIVSDIHLIQNKQVTNAPILYNGYNDEVVLQDTNQLKLIQLDKDLITGFRFYKFNNDTNVLFEKIKVKKVVYLDSTEIFAQLLHADKVSLYAYHTIYVAQIQYLRDDNDRIIDKPIFKPKTVYYFKLPGNKTIGFEKLRKKHLYSLFPDKKEEIDQKFKEYKKRRLRTENDFIQITKIISQLL
jgi:hypothetical protein